MRRKRMKNIPEENAIETIYRQFIETGSVENYTTCQTTSTEKMQPNQSKESQSRSESQSNLINAIHSKNIWNDEASMSEVKIHGLESNIMQDRPNENNQDKLRHTETTKLLAILTKASNDGLVYFSSEAVFSSSGLIATNNRRSSVLKTNLTESQEETMIDSGRIKVWCAVSSKNIIGPFFFNNQSTTTNDYLNMLRRYFYPIIKNSGIEEKVYFQLDDISTYFSDQLYTWLDEHFHNRWIGTGGPIIWAPHSADLIAFDVFIWQYVERCIYTTPISDVSELKARIIEELKQIKQETLRQIFNSLIERMESCLS